MRAPRLGQIGFLNCATIDAGLARQTAAADFAVAHDTPVGLARRLARGELDVSAISAIEYLRNADDYLLIPGVAIGSSGAVRSVSLVSRTRPELLSGVVAATDASTTSHVLLEILIRDLWHAAAETESRSLEDDALAGSDAALVIGDQALRLAARPPANSHTTDLGEAWRELTGADMVFAVWAARREFAESDPAGLAAVAGALRSAALWAGDRSHTQTARLALASGMPRTQLDDYYRCLRFDFDARARAGLRAFAGAAKTHRRIDSVPAFEFADVAALLAEAV
jgi:chorismate dehydratase